MQDPEIADLKEISELIYEKYNYDFRNYAMSSFKRRVVRILEKKKLTIGNLLKKLDEAPPFVDEFVGELTVNVTEMFRDPRFWQVIRQEVLPTLRRQHNHIKIWHAGCSSGEEVLSMCVLIKELGMQEHVSVIATDLDDTMLQLARAHRYPMKNMELNQRNYQDAGGTVGLENYYSQQDGHALFAAELFKGVLYQKHDLVLGDVFDQFHLIFCRNVMIYFNEILQNYVLRKFHQSLLLDGFLAIGSKESLIWCDDAKCFMALNGNEKIYRKITERS
jgi:chemotaxis protein methyltransferase CheR